MDSHAEKFAELAERIERELKHIDDAAVAARLKPVQAPERVPHWLARALSTLRRGSKAQPSTEDEAARRFEEAQRCLESLEKYGAKLAQAAAQEAANAREWERNAKLAVRAGDDDLARHALCLQREALERASALERQAATIAAAMAEYTSALAAIKASSR